MSEKFDVVIAGGAIMGSSTAYHLAADPGFTGRVLVVEKDMTYAKSATALSLSSIRQQFSSPINIRVGLAGVAFLRELKQTLEVDGEAPDVPFTENGYLYLASEAGAQTLRDNHVVQAREGAANRAAFARRDRGALSLSQRGRRRARRARAPQRRLVRQLSAVAGVPPQGAQPRRRLSRGKGRRGRARRLARHGGEARQAASASPAARSSIRRALRGRRRSRAASGSKSPCARANAASSCSRPSRAGWIARSSSIRTASFFARKGSPSSRGSRRPRPRTPTATISR